MMSEAVNCPCCFSRTLSGRGGFEICEVCYWEDDGQDDADADVVRGGPNGTLSLTAARANYATQRVSYSLHSASVRRPFFSELTERSPTVVAPPNGRPEPSTFALLNCNDRSPRGEVDIICPSNADDSWRKRMAILSAFKSKRSSAGDLLNFADLHLANLRDIDLSAEVGEVDFSHALLDEVDFSLAVLHNVKMTGTSLRKANLSAVLMTNASLPYARLDGANIEMAYFCGSTFNGAILKGLDFGSANWSGAIIQGAIIEPKDCADVPRIPNIHAAVYACARAPGAFDMRTWHSCETTHCRAGWAVTLAGQAGTALEESKGTAVAAALIYLASDPHLERIPDFHASDEDAMADMRRLAELTTIRPSTADASEGLGENVSSQRQAQP
jgi:uncharacterized protein YjbI with pentapeptide repeats